MAGIEQSFKQLYIFGKIFGVLPFSFDSQKKRFQRSMLAQLYTTFLLGITTLANPVLIRAFIKRVDLNFKAQPVGSNITAIYRYVNLGMTLTLILQLCYQKKIIQFLNNGLRITKVLLQQSSKNFSSKFYKLHLAQLTASVVWWILLSLQLQSYFISPNLVDILYTTAVMAPIMSITAMSAIFVLCIRLLLQGYTCVGEQIIIQTSKSLTKQCKMSDDLDLLRGHFRMLNDLLRTLVQVLSVPIFFLISLSFIGSVRGCFLQYMRFTGRLPKSIMGSKMLLLISIILGVFLVLLAIYVQLSSKVAATIRDIGRKLHLIEFNSDLDTRLKQSIELFSIQVYQDQPRIAIFSMFELNNGMLYSMIGFGTTTLIMLIQTVA